MQLGEVQFVQYRRLVAPEDGGMKKIINSTYISLDGVIENPQDWPVPPDDGTGGRIQSELLFACDAVLMGRRTYEGFAPVWSARSGDPLSDRINSMSKYVVSTTLTDPKWTNTTVIADDVITQVSELKRQPGHDIVQYGFGQLSYELLAHGLLDELRLWVHPLFVGRGGPGDLLYRDSDLAQLELVATQPLTSGIVVLTYRMTES
jgi:dihydrofolate reductase